MTHRFRARLLRHNHNDLVHNLVGKSQTNISIDLLFGKVQTLCRILSTVSRVHEEFPGMLDLDLLGLCRVG